jgi:hypothetical protein
MDSVEIFEEAEEWLKNNPDKDPDRRERYTILIDNRGFEIECFKYREYEYLNSRRHVFYNCGGGEIASFSSDFQVIPSI